MTYRSVEDIKTYATRGMRRAFVVTALLSEMKTVRGHLTGLTSGYSEGTGRSSSARAHGREEWLAVLEQLNRGPVGACEVAAASSQKNAQSTVAYNPSPGCDLLGDPGLVRRTTCRISRPASSDASSAN